MNPDGMVALLDFREDGVTPYMIFFKDGLEIEKCVSSGLEWANTPNHVVGSECISGSVVSLLKLNGSCQLKNFQFVQVQPNCCFVLREVAETSLAYC